MKSWFISIFFLFFSCISSASTLYIAAPSSMTKGLKEIAERYQNQYKTDVKLIFGASSVMARQIQKGFPADLFISADPQWMAELTATHAEASIIPFASNQLVIVTHKKNQIMPWALNDSYAWEKNLKGKLAIGDPSYVPLGHYTKEFMQQADIWSILEPKLARMNNARTTLSLVERNAVTMGVVYKTDAQQSSYVKVIQPIPREMHSVIHYSFMVLTPSDETEKFQQFLLSLESKAILEQYGFDVLPTQSSSPNYLLNGH